ASAAKKATTAPPTGVPKTVATLDTHHSKARYVLAVVEDNREDALHWLTEYDALLPTEGGAAYRRVHLTTLTFWLIARDRYHMTLPTNCLHGLPDTLRSVPMDRAALHP
ncbi:MAG TPA: hypothetical protein VIG44_11420, partial [Thermomicrobiales bacterium]